MTVDDDLPDDEATRLLAQVMHDEVDDLVVSGDSLRRIQSRTASSHGRPPIRWIAPLAAAALIAVVAAGAALLPNGGFRTVSPPTSGTTSTSPTPLSSTPATNTPSPSATDRSPSPNSTSGAPRPSGTSGPDGGLSSACIGAGRAGYAYYVSDLNGLGPRLYRGMVTTTCHLGIEEALTVPAGKDVDYTSPWPAGTEVLGMNVSESLATVDVSAFPETTSQIETAAVQQLVYTITANDPSIARVRLLVNGETPPGTLDWSSPVRRAAALGTLSNVWILTPGNHATVSSPVAVRIYGTGYEGLVPLQVVNTADPTVVVASGSVLTQMGAHAEAQTTFDLPPGTYELRAYNDNAVDGSLTLWDTKVFTVE